MHRRAELVRLLGESGPLTVTAIRAVNRADASISCADAYGADVTVTSAR